MVQKINNLLARSILALIVGPLVGVALAISICGLLAVLLDLRGILAECRDSLKRLESQ